MSLEDITVLQAKRVGVVTCRQEDSLVEAARIMAEDDVSALVVVDPDGYLVGVISRTDMLRALVASDHWQEIPVREYMSKDVVTVPVHQSLTDVAEVLLNEHIHRVIVVRPEQGRLKPVAVVSAADLVYHMTRS